MKRKISFQVLSDYPGKFSLLLAIWPTTASYQELRRQMAWHAKNIAEEACASPTRAGASLSHWAAELWAVTDRLLFTRCLSLEKREHIAALSRLLQDAKLPEGDDLDGLLKDDNNRDLIARVTGWGVGGLAAHFGLWVTLLWLYPRYSWVQAVFFWNASVRKLFGLHLALLIPCLSGCHIHAPWVDRKVRSP
jgi:hypothetical protein